MREADEASTWKSQRIERVRARLTGGSHGLTTDDPVQHGEGAKGRPRLGVRPEKRGQGQYKGRSPKAARGDGLVFQLGIKQPVGQSPPQNLTVEQLRLDTRLY